MASPVAIGLGWGLFVARLARRSRGSAAMTVAGGAGSPTLETMTEILRQLLIVIPARNEESSLPGLLQSLTSIRKAGATIVVIDDQSTDKTATVAREFGVMVQTTEARPDEWSGKNWACQKGYEFWQQQGDRFKYILFTDADTHHSYEGLSQALAWFAAEKADLMTARPFHRTQNFWEKVMGPFYLLILFLTDAMKTDPRVNRHFSIGQFLLFRSEFYHSIGGHSRVRSELAEDLALSRMCFQNQRRFVTCPFDRVYSVQMYRTLLDFFKGWKRNFRLGMEKSSFQTVVEICLVMVALLSPGAWWSYTINVALIAFLQRRQGAFHWLGAVFYPLGVGAFILVSISATVENLFHKPILWKSREYYR